MLVTKKHLESLRTAINIVKINTNARIEEDVKSQKQRYFSKQKSNYKSKRK